MAKVSRAREFMSQAVTVQPDPQQPSIVALLYARGRI
jgi:hypothetical protein